MYGEKAKLFDTYAARPIDAVIPVDAYVHGCPINREEFLSVVKSLLLGKKPTNHGGISSQKRNSQARSGS